jgi:hypothetical protein
VHWQEIGEAISLTSEELRAIADIVAPYMR